MPEFTISVAHASPEPAVGGSMDAKAILPMRCETKAVFGRKMDYGKLTSHNVEARRKGWTRRCRWTASFGTAIS